VQDGEYNVEPRYGTASWFVAIAHHEATSAARDQSDLRRLVGDRKRSSAGSRAITGIADKPSTVPGDADERNLVTVRVQGSKDVGSRRSGDFMFSRASSEQKRDRDLAMLPNHQSTMCYWAVATAIGSNPRRRLRLNGPQYAKLGRRGRSDGPLIVGFAFREHRPEFIPQFDRDAIPAHNDALLND
jgi:hypothetical protein